MIFWVVFKQSRKKKKYFWIIPDLTSHKEWAITYFETPTTTPASEAVIPFLRSSSHSISREKLKIALKNLKSVF